VLGDLGLKLISTFAGGKKTHISLSIRNKIYFMDIVSKFKRAAWEETTWHNAWGKGEDQ
jgi:hypothetical protein